ncbi:hypothetical protein Mapa_009807 [Marchantia paleacea]|nr:hypothetical protein Mapa_009807 [Marchantia paleacea]
MFLLNVVAPRRAEESRSWLQTPPLVQPGHLIGYCPHDGLAGRNPHQPWQKAFPQSSRALFHGNSLKCVHHSRVASAFVDSRHSIPSLRHQPGFDYVERSCGHGPSCSCEESRDHRLPRKKCLAISFFFLPQNFVTEVFRREHDGLIRPVAHHRRCSPCPKAQNTLFVNDGRGAVHGTLVLEKISRQASLLLQSDFHNLKYSKHSFVTATFAHEFESFLSRVISKIPNFNALIRNKPIHRHVTSEESEL